MRVVLISKRKVVDLTYGIIVGVRKARVIGAVPGLLTKARPQPDNWYYRVFFFHAFDIAKHEIVSVFNENF